MGMSLNNLRELVMYREVCCAAVHGVKKSQTWLSDWTELNWCGTGLFSKRCQIHEFIWSSQVLESIQSLERHVLELLLWLQFHRFFPSKALISSHRNCNIKVKKLDQTKLRTYHLPYKIISPAQVGRLPHFCVQSGGEKHLHVWPSRWTLVAQRLKHLPAMRETPGSIPGSGRSPGEGNGDPLWYSCVGNPMDGGAWWPTAHGVAKSRTRLSDFTSLYVSLWW